MTIRPMIVAVAALLAAPAVAQTPPPLVAPGGLHEGHAMRGGRHGGPGMAMRSLSPEGRQIMATAMREQADQADRAALKAARDRVNELLGADRLDVAALRRAMDEERRLAGEQHQRRQEAMLGAFQKLSAADRKAFAADARTGRDRMGERMKAWRDKRDSPTTTPTPAT